MSYESTKTSTNSSGGETMTNDMSSQSAANNFYPNNNRTQAMIMNPMMGTGNYYNGPPQGTPQQGQMPYRAMYQSYSSAPPPHLQHHQIVSFRFVKSSFF